MYLVLKPRLGERNIRAKKNMKVMIFMMLPLYFGPVRPTIISTPENVAVQRGVSTELICRANSGSSVSSWAFTAYQGSAKDVTIYSREIKIISNRTSFQKITDTNGFLNIKTDSVQPRDAGIYTCTIKLQEGEELRVVQHSAHLIVLDSVPNCTAIDYSSQLNGRKFKRLSCSVSFRSDWSPVMEWRQGGFNGTIVTTGVQSHRSSNFVSQSISISVDDGEENTISYTCIIFFAAYMGNVSATATNIPKYTFIWSDRSNGLPVELPTPANAVVIKGSNSTMVCKKFSAFTVYNWTFTAAGTSTVGVIFSREMGINPKFPRYHYNDDHTSSKLSIKSTQFEDAGTYTCTKPASASSGIIQESAQLIVLESNPKCSEQERQEDTNGHREVIFHLSCTVAFRGNWAPLMEWRFTDAHGEIVEHGVNMSTAMNHNVTSRLRLVASTTRQNAKYICRTFFGNTPGSVLGSAKNIPYYNYTWTSSVINESNDVSLVTLIVSLAVVVIAILVALIVYHMFFKSFLAGQHRVLVPPAVMTASFQTVQESDYAAIRETETITVLSHGQRIEEQRTATDEGEIHVYHSVAYGELLGSEDHPPHYYRKLPSASPTIIEGSSALHSYANVPVMVDLPTPSAAILSDGNIQ